MKRITTALLLACCVTSHAGEVIKGSERHTFVLADSGLGKILKFAPDGKLLWEHPAPNCYDVQVLPNGNILFTYKRQGKDYGVKEVTPGKKTVWEYQASGEVFSARRLPNGNTLVAECTNAKLIEVSPDGSVVKSFDLKSKNKGHGTMRMVRVTKKGTYLVGQVGDRAVREYDADGRLIWECAVPGPAYGAIRLPNGSTLVSCQHSVIEFDKTGTAVWTLNAKEIPEVAPKWLACIVRLPNGNTVVGNWLGHHQEGKGVPLFEVTPDKKIVWQFTDTQRTRHASNFMIVD